MMTEAERSNPKALWQGQESESGSVPLESLLRQAQELGARARRGVIMSVGRSSIATVVVLVVVASDPPQPSRMMITLLLLGALLVLMWARTVRRVYSANRTHRWVWPGALDPAVALESSVEFYRAELMNRKDRYVKWWYRQTWVAVLIGIVTISPAVYMATLSGAWLNILPFCLVVGCWAFSSVYFGRRTADRIQLELDELDAFRRGSQGASLPGSTSS